MQPQISTAQPMVDAQLQAAPMKPARENLIVNPAQLFSHEERAMFYTGQDRKTLQINNIERVRDLQAANDNLQRQITRNEKDMPNSQDPLVLLAEIEHTKFLIARNTGEILNIHSQDAMRLQRIRELEALNIDLRQEMSETQTKFVLSHEMDDRTKYAASFFLSKATLEKNLAEIDQLNQE